MAEAFPLPGSSYKELIKIIQGYGTVGENVTPADEEFRRISGSRMSQIVISPRFHRESTQT